MKKKFEIWQTDDRNRAFMRSDFLKDNGMRIVKDKSYSKVYEGEIDTEDGEDENATLERIFAKYQGTKPEGYTGRSVSVSDMITMGGNTYFTDDYGFKKMSKSAAAGSVG